MKPKRSEQMQAEQVQDRLRYYAQNPEFIGGRMQQLDREWDMERAVDANVAGLALAGLALAAVDKRFLALPAIAGASLLLFALSGWCPSVPLLRRLGVRSKAEITRERYALKVLRGELNPPENLPVAPLNRARAALQAVA